MNKSKTNEQILDETELDIGNDAVSHTETTGLMPTPVSNEYEDVSYRQIVNFKQRPIVHKEKYTHR